MKHQSKNLQIKAQCFSQVQIYKYSDGSQVGVLKKSSQRTITLKKRGRFPPVNRNEPMTKAAYRRTLNRYFERLHELDLCNENCRFVTLTISKEQYNSYDKICNHFNYWIDCIREKVKDDFAGFVRFVEVQEKGFFHIHCILVFSQPNIVLTWSELNKMWKWGFVKIKSIDDRFGLIDYLTNSKSSTKYKINSKFTRYPKSARVIYISPNLPKLKSENFSISTSEFTVLAQDAQCIHIKTHHYIGRDTQELQTAIDKIVFVKSKLEGVKK